MQDHQRLLDDVIGRVPVTAQDEGALPQRRADLPSVLGERLTRAWIVFHAANPLQ
jgi:hypothetical protein